jgi:protein required for attachment to host cells
MYKFFQPRIRHGCGIHVYPARGRGLTIARESTSPGEQQVMAGFRVLVADKVKAQLYAMPTRRSSLKSLECFVNPAGRQPERALGSGRPGRVTSGTGGGRHTFEARHTIKEHAGEVFVKQVAAAVAADARRNGEAGVVLVAAPRLLGAYRRQLPAAVRDRIVAEVRLDLTKLPPIELNKRVREAVASARATSPRIR